MRPTSWGLLFGLLGICLWLFLASTANFLGLEPAVFSFLLATSIILILFSLPISIFFELAQKRPKLRYVAYALTIFAIICWLGFFSNFVEQSKGWVKPIKIRNVEIVKDGSPVATNVHIKCSPPPQPQYGEVELNLDLWFVYPPGVPATKTSVQDIRVLTNGFDVKSVEPPLPIELWSGKGVTLTVTLKGPRERFDGSLVLKITFG